MLVALALPHLPSPIPFLVTNGLKYSQMLGAIRDDIAGVVVAFGFIVWIAGMVST